MSSHWSKSECRALERYASHPQPRRGKHKERDKKGRGDNRERPAWMASFRRGGIRCRGRLQTLGRLRDLDGSNEAVSSAGQCLDVAGIARGFAERFPQLLNRRVDAVIELDHGIVRPQLQPDFLAQDHLTGMVEQHHQDLEGLLADPDFDSVLTQFTGTGIGFERAEADPPRRENDLEAASMVGHFSSPWYVQTEIFKSLPRFHLLTHMKSAR